MHFKSKMASGCNNLPNIVQRDGIFLQAKIAVGCAGGDAHPHPSCGFATVRILSVKKCTRFLTTLF